MLSVCLHELLNAWSNLYETWYVRVYHATWAHLNSTLHNFLPSVCVCVYVYPLLLLGNGSVKIPLLLLSNGSVKPLPWQQIHMQQ
jgi:hypothetical protein